MIMVLTTVPRRIAKLEYSVVRLPFTLLLEHVVTRHWDEEARLRLGFERLLGSLDGFAGRLLADSDISRRGQARMRRAEFLAMAGQLETTAQAQAQTEEKLQAERAQARQAREQAEEEMDNEIAAAYQKALEDEEDVRRAVDALSAAEEAQAEHVARKRAAKEPDMPVKPAAEGSSVDVTFILPAEVQADSVVLCGEFNEWSADNIRLERGSDGSWRATVALEPGRSYRYRYLLDGERWENGWQTDGYVPNSYGSDDSVVVVE